MGILNNMWIALTTENELISKILCLPLVVIESILTLLLFTAILNITFTKKQAIIYIAFTSILGVLCTFFIPKPYSNLITLTVIPFAIMYIFKISFLKSIFAEFLPIICITVLEIILSRFFLLILGETYDVSANIPICRFTITSIIYIIIFGLYKLIRYYKFNINIFDSVNSKNKKVIIFNILFAILVIFMQIYLIVFYNDNLPSFIVFINILSLIAYFFISIYSLIKTMNLEKVQEELEQEKNYNKTLQIMHDNVRAFKHDFSNIISGIGGYVDTGDLPGLKKYYHELLQDCQQVTTLGSLNPDTINNPAVYSVLTNKYYKAEELGIKISLECFIDFTKLNMDIYEFTRILGILMDNAIEASSECEEKIINVMIRNDSNMHRQLLIIENTYKNKDINVDKIYEKGYSTKLKNTGLGLWEVNKIISKHQNLARYTTKTDEFFKQQIEIYKQ